MSYLEFLLAFGLVALASALYPPLNPGSTGSSGTPVTSAGAGVTSPGAGATSPVAGVTPNVVAPVAPVAPVGPGGEEVIMYYTPPPDIQDALRHHLIIPQLLRYGPEFKLHVVYGNNSEVKLGNKFTAEQLEKEPTSLKWSCREDAFHTLVVVGLDVPTMANSTERDWKHWILVNIPANKIEEGETVVPYQGPGFSYENGIHRMVFMVYEQPWRHTISFSEVALKDSPVRPKFDSNRFAEKYDLHEPIAVNFLLCETNWPVPTKSPLPPLRL